MTEKNYLMATGLIFALVALLHLFRLINHWQASIGGWDAPMWVSWVGLIVGAMLSLWAFRLAARKRGLI